MGKILIKNGSLVTAEKTILADLLIEGEKISRIGHGIDAV